MKASPLQLTDYFLTEFHLSANSRFDPKQDVPLKPDDFQVAVEVLPGKDSRHWQVIVKLQHQPPADANVPYRFTAEIVGFYLVLSGYPDDRIEMLVHTNGPSMLYGLLRGIVKDATSRGPYDPVLLPSASFYDSPKAAQASAQAPLGNPTEQSAASQPTAPEAPAAPAP
jgi:preprotein translocase subunit SecB